MKTSGTILQKLCRIVTRSRRMATVVNKNQEFVVAPTQTEMPESSLPVREPCDGIITSVPTFRIHGYLSLTVILLMANIGKDTDLHQHDGY